MPSALGRLVHRLAHRAGWNVGQVVTWTAPGVPGRVMVGHRCSTCGVVTGIQPAVFPRSLTDPRRGRGVQEER